MQMYVTTLSKICLSRDLLIQTIYGMRSSEGESFEFKAPVVADGPVETWMTKVEGEMRRTLHDIMKEGVFYYAQMERVKFVMKYLGMVAITGNVVCAIYRLITSSIVIPVD